MDSFQPPNRRECFGWELNPDQHSPLWPMRWTMSQLAWGFLRKNARSTRISHWHAAVEAPARLAGKMETAQTRTFSTCRKNCQLCPLPMLVPCRPTSAFYSRPNYHMEDHASAR